MALESDVIRFIEEDSAKGQMRGRGLCGVALILGILVTTLGLGFRIDYHGAWSLATLLPCIPMALIVFAFPWIANATRRVKLSLFLVLAFLSLAFSLMLPDLSESITSFSSSSEFTKAAVKCLLFGGLSSGIFAAILLVLFSLVFPTPTRLTRILASATAGLGGMIVLGLHCSANERMHIVVAHWGQGILIYPFAYATFSALFKRKMKNVLGAESSTVGDWSRLG
jgi:hypothetical protein